MSNASPESLPEEESSSPEQVVTKQGSPPIHPPTLHEDQTLSCRLGGSCCV